MALNNIERNGRVIIVSGPSGAGKSTICSAVRKDSPELYFSISCTTRKLRGTEEHGKDYYFISHEEFKKRIANDEFVEYAEVYGNFYGTLKSELADNVKKGLDVLLDIDVQGAMQIKKRAASDKFLSECIELVFIAPPSYGILEARLRNRKTDSEEAIIKRLNTSKSEMEFWREYDYIIVNDDMNEAVNAMKTVVSSFALKTRHIRKIDFNV